MVEPTSITPTLEQVASRILSRTRDRHGNRGTFNDDTVPTAAEAQVHITTAARYVANRIGKPGTEWEGDLETMATDAVAARAALLIEYAFYSDRADSDVDQLGRIAREELDALIDTAKNNQVGGWRIHSIQQITAPVASAEGLLPEQIGNGPEVDE